MFAEKKRQDQQEDAYIEGPHTQLQQGLDFGFIQFPPSPFLKILLVLIPYTLLCPFCILE